jgi:hypothetical protein
MLNQFRAEPNPNRKRTGSRKRQGWARQMTEVVLSVKGSSFFGPTAKLWLRVDQGPSSSLEVVWVTIQTRESRLLIANQC